MTNRIIFRILAALMAIVSIVIVYQHIKATEVDMVLSCRNELVAKNPNSDTIEHHSLIADFTLQKRSASISYRYFTTDGNPIATLYLTGDVLSAYKEKDTYILNLTHNELIRHNTELPLPQHASHLEAFAKRNISKKGVHNLTIQITNRNAQLNTVLLYFLPSTNICACNLVEMK
ncbi:hypothetical protein [Shewanella sp. 10N.286.48.B5]|uniref:hypothetical protein n=1 Tax=Shewanella sp. 10N.286.48.B5 TaxID=1880834 RepID=UPI001055B2A9|nr:hypothetical protein [Shewanella sp. 10N.286.48.B5]